MYLSSVKLDGETPRVPEGFGAATFMDDGGETDNQRRLDSGGSEEVGAGEVRDVMSHLEEPFGACASSMDHTFGDSLTCEVGYLLYQMVVL